MKELKILRKMLKSEEPGTSNISGLSREEEKWFGLGFKSAKSRFEGLIDLLEEEQ